MFGLAPSEIAVIVAVALVALGPKDLPVALRWFTDVVKKGRVMAAEFQTHVDEMIREADLGEVRKQIDEIRNFDVRGVVAEAVDPDHTLRDTFASNPLEPTPASSDLPPVGSAGEASGDLAVAELDRPAASAEAPAVVVAADQSAPAFVPPALAATAPQPSTEPNAQALIPPAFIPPAIARSHVARAAL